MKHFLIIFLIFILSTPTCQKKTDDIINQRTMISYDDTLNRHQLDSLFIVDTLSFNVENDWILSRAVKGDDSDFLYKYVYIKELTDSTQLLYTLCTYQDTLYIINKRIVK